MSCSGCRASPLEVAAPGGLPPLGLWGSGPVPHVASQRGEGMSRSHPSVTASVQHYLQPGPHKAPVCRPHFLGCLGQLPQEGPWLPCPAQGPHFMSSVPGCPGHSACHAWTRLPLLVLWLQESALPIPPGAWLPSCHTVLWNLPGASKAVPLHPRPAGIVFWRCQHGMQADHVPSSSSEVQSRAI